MKKDEKLKALFDRFDNNIINDIQTQLDEELSKSDKDFNPDKVAELTAVIAQIRDEAAAAGHGSGGTAAAAKDATQGGLSQQSADQGAYGHGRFDRYMEDDDNPPPKLRIRK